MRNGGFTTTNVQAPKNTDSQSKPRIIRESRIKKTDKYLFLHGKLFIPSYVCKIRKKEFVFCFGYVICLFVITFYLVIDLYQAKSDCPTV